MKEGEVKRMSVRDIFNKLSPGAGDWMEYAEKHKGENSLDDLYNDYIKGKHQ